MSRTALITRSSLGFTVLELVITMLIVSILLGIGAPSLWSLIEENRASTAANKLVTSLNAARTHAISRRRNVTVCTSDDGTSCRTGGDTDYKNWHAGWMTKLDASGEVLETQDGLTTAFELTSDDNAVQFDPSGAITAGSMITFSLTIPECTGDKQREIEISTTGRISVDQLACP